MKSPRAATSSMAVSVPVTILKGRMEQGIWKRQRGHLLASVISVKKKSDCVLGGKFYCHTVPLALLAGYNINLKTDCHGRVKSASAIRQVLQSKQETGAYGGVGGSDHTRCPLLSV